MILLWIIGGWWVFGYLVVFGLWLMVAFNGMDMYGCCYGNLWLKIAKEAWKWPLYIVNIIRDLE